MFSDIVDQNAIMPISAGKNTGQKSLPQPSLDGSDSTAPKPAVWIVNFLGDLRRHHTSTSRRGHVGFWLKPRCLTRPPYRDDQSWPEVERLTPADVGHLGRGDGEELDVGVQRQRRHVEH